MKTKNAPKDLKCKINDTFFLETGVPKRGGGGVRHLGKVPKKSRFFWGGVPYLVCCLSCCSACSALVFYLMLCCCVVSCFVLLSCKTETRSCGQARSTAGSVALFCFVQTSSMFCTLQKNSTAHCTELNSRRREAKQAAQ